MGKRRGRTGSGGAVVSSLSEHSGGSVNVNTKRGNAATSGSAGRRGQDAELLELAGLSGKAKKNTTSGAGPSSAGQGSASATPSSSKWLGKSPQQMLQEWCIRNNRKRPYFSKMVGSQGRLRCTIPPGRKDGKKAKGSAFDIVVGVGEHPGDDFAALNVLHQVERGKPLERLLAPEFRSTWLDLDNRFDEMQSDQKRRAETAEKRKEATVRRAKFEKSKESATINISAASRQMIEDALVEQKSTTGASSQGPNSLKKSANESEAMMLQKRLMKMGFSEFDSTHASRMFQSVTPAIDYLCLNLDESELPKSFAPTADIEVVRFKPRGGMPGCSLLNPDSRDMLTHLVCLSRRAAEKALRESGGDFCVAALILYNSLTSKILSQHVFPDAEDVDEFKSLRILASQERSIEAESVAAIYGDDAKTGRGALPAFSKRWATVVGMQDGIPGINHDTAVSIAVVDVDGLYPYTAPLVLVSSSFDQLRKKVDAINPAHRRLLMRAAAGEVVKLRRASLLGEKLDEATSSPLPVVHAVLSFLASASKDDLLSSASFEALEAVHALETQPRDTAGLIDKGTTSKANLSRKTAQARSRKFSSLLPVSPLRSSPELESMQKRRRSLPAHQARSEIIQSVKHNQVTVISGATGSGKTTQAPQFLLEDATETQLPIFMICTQPRRIAAISVAERVAAERCEKVGGSIGYQVKLNSKTSGKTRLVFCTTGVLLRRLQGDPKLDSITHVFVDEVHERSVETDFLLLLLREILEKRPALRVVLMSATLDAKKFSAYFANRIPGRSKQVPVISIPGRTFPVDELYLADAVKLAKYKLRSGDRYARRPSKVYHPGKYGPSPNREPGKNGNRKYSSEDKSFGEEMDDSANTESDDDSMVQVSGKVSSMQVDVDSISFQDGKNVNVYKETVSLIDETQVNLDLIDLLVKRIDVEGRSRRDVGAILVFLPGAAEISAVMKRLSSGAGASHLWPLPLHSLLSPQDQSKVFLRSPKGKRKVICSTNIAETSITVEDVTIVIDTLRVKEMSYDSVNGSSVLEECFISKSAAKQRAGRAGRVSKGTCYRLVREHTFTHRLAQQQTPEIKRVALEHLVLNILSIIPEQQSKNDPQSFLAAALDPPDAQAVTKAVTNLTDLGALEILGSTGNWSNGSVRLTALGKHLSGLPVDARIGKLLVYGSVFGCVDAALTIAATVSERSPFFSPFEKRGEARAARERFAWGKSDLLTFVKAFDAWKEVKQQGGGYGAEAEFCSKHFLSRKTLQSISDGRKQLAFALSDAGFGPSRGDRANRGWESDPEVNQFGDNLRVLRAVVCAALYPNVVRIDLPDTLYQEVAGGNIAKDFISKQLKLRAKNGERVFIHPESVNFFQGNYETRWLAYFSKVQTSKVFIRDATMVSPYAILLFGGEITINHEKGQMSVDNWVIFKAPARVAVLARELRRELDNLLLRKFEDADVSVSEEGRAISEVIVRLITTES